MMTRLERAPGIRHADLLEVTAQFDREDVDVEAEVPARAAAVVCPAPETRASRSLPRDGRLPEPVLGRALRYMSDNLDSKLKWEEIASAVGMDAFRFGRAFKRAIGMTVHQYVIRCRVTRAMDLLAHAELEHSIADIALEVGCSCQSHLTTMFRKHTGTTPAAFRKAATGSWREATQPTLRPFREAFAIAAEPAHA